jgi:hypothetical protein
MMTEPHTLEATTGLGLEYSDRREEWRRPRGGNNEMMTPYPPLARELIECKVDDRVCP